MKDLQDTKDWVVEMIVETLIDEGAISSEDEKKVYAYLNKTNLSENILDLLEKWGV